MNNALLITSISGRLNLSGFIDPAYKKAVENDLQKGEITDALRYDNNFKYSKTGKEIKDALVRAKSSYQLKKDDLANKLSIAKESLSVKPFAPISSWQMRGFEKQLGIQMNYPYEFFRYIEYPQDNGAKSMYGNASTMSIDDCCTRINKQFACALTSEHFPTSPEDAEPYYQYNRLLDDYIQQAVDILQLNIMIKNMNEKKSYDLSQSQIMALDQYMDEPADDLTKGENDQLEKGGEGSGRKIGTTKSGKKVICDFASTKCYKDFTPADHKDAAALHEQEGNKLEEKSKLSSAQYHFALAKHHLKKASESKKESTNLQKAFETLGFDESLNDIEKGGMKKTMEEFKAGDLHSGSKKGPVVTNRKQAIAIGLSEQDKEKSMDDNDIEEAEVEHEHNLKPGSKIRFNKKEHKVKEVVGNMVHFHGERTPVHISKIFNTKGDNIIKAEEDNDIEENEDAKKSKDATNHIIEEGKHHYIDSLDPDTEEVKYEPGASIHYTTDDGKTHSGTVSDKKHPKYDQVYKIDKNKGDNKMLIKGEKDDLSKSPEGTVKVTGDRGLGSYHVTLGKEYRGKDKMEDETIHHAVIHSHAAKNNPYNYKPGDKVKVVKGSYGKGGHWGGIDPLVGVKE